MRSKFRTTLVGLVAMLALGAVGSAASAASAAEWYVAGGPLSGSASLATLTTHDESQIIELGSGLSVTCTGTIEFKNGKLTATNSGSVEHIVFNGCTSGSQQCKIKGTKMETKALNMEAALGEAGSEDKVLLTPQNTGKVFIEYTMTGEGCRFEGIQKITGEAWLKLPSGREEHAEQEFSLVGKELHGIGTAGLSNAKAKLKLASGSAWSFH